MESKLGGTEICIVDDVAPVSNLLKAESLSENMIIGGGEAPHFCEDCGSPLEDGFCYSCRGGFREGAGPVGAAPLDRKELSAVLGRWVGPRTHGSYALSMQQEEGMAPLRKEIESLVEQFSASPEVKNSVKQNAERTAFKLQNELGPTKAAIASVAQEYLKLGRNLLEVSLSISRARPRIGQLGDLVIEVYPTSQGRVSVLINGRERVFRSYSHGLYRKLRIQLFVGDGNATAELRNAHLTRNGYDDKRVKPLGPSNFILSVDERNFELFKLLEEAKLSGELVGNEVDLRTMFRKYSVSKLHLTERLLREAGLIQIVSAEYAKRCARKMKNGQGRSPKKLAEEALIEACERLVPPGLCDLIVEKYHLKESAVNSLVVRPELDAWQG